MRRKIELYRPSCLALRALALTFNRAAIWGHPAGSLFLREWTASTRGGGRWLLEVVIEPAPETVPLWCLPMRRRGCGNAGELADWSLIEPALPLAG